MGKKLMVLGIAGIAAILLSAVTVAQTLHAKSKPEIPFVGMSLVYYAVDYNGDTQIRTISVLRYDEATNCVTMRDSFLGDWMIIDVGTREFVWSSGYWKPSYVEYWIPTNVKVGSHVGILDSDAVVTGSTVLSVEGNHVRVWELQATYTAGGGSTIYGQTTWYYEKRTGLWIAAAWVEWDENGIPLSDRNWGGHLVSTNVNLIEGAH